MRSRIWIIPAIIIVLVAGAWLFRWENNGQQGNKAYFYDRWLSQGWVKVVSPTAFYEAPVIAQDVLLLEKDKQAVILGAADNVSNNQAIMARNLEKADGFQDYEKKGVDVYSSVKFGYRDPASLSDYEKQALRDYMKASGKTTDLREFSSTYVDLKGAFDSYWNAHNENIRIDKQIQVQATQFLFKKAVDKRRIASIGSLLVGLAAVIWLVTVFLLYGKTNKTVHKEMGSSINSERG